MSEESSKSIPEFIVTEDGSHSLLLRGLNETYHSRHGAVRESEHVFISNGLIPVSKMKPKLNVLEIGFGTGLNAWLTMLNAVRMGWRVHYISMETNPLDKEIYTKLNYSEGHSETERNHFIKMHEAEWGRAVEIAPGFMIEKINLPVQQYSGERKIDLVYYDAFGPEAQPEMWDISIFRKLYEMMEANAILVTYCAKGQVRRDLISCGFVVERLPGPPGKREMIRATKKEQL